MVDSKTEKISEISQCAPQSAEPGSLGFCYAKATHHRTTTAPPHHHRTTAPPDRSPFCTGVRFCSSIKPWRGTLNDRLARTSSGKKRHRSTSYFEDESECILATRALRVEINRDYQKITTSRAASDPLTKGLPRGPDNPSSAQTDVVYWRPNKQNAHEPYPVVRSGIKKVRWVSSCQVSGCFKIAQPKNRGQPGLRIFCTAHRDLG